MNIHTSCNSRPFFLVGVWALISVGCASIGPDPGYRGPFPHPDDAAEAYHPNANWAESSRETMNGGFERITLTAPDQDDSITMDYYRFSPNGRHPPILVSPIFGGKNRVASHFARYLSKRGYHCLVVHRPPDLKEGIDSPSALENRLASAVRRDRAALDWLSRQPGAASEALGSFGISYGGIKNAVLAGVDNQLKVNVFALAGGDLASIVTHSNLDKLGRITETMREKENLTLPELEQRLRDTLQTEPLRTAPWIDPKTTLLFIARSDKTVPRHNGELLRQALGRPKTIYLPTGHYSGILFTGMLGIPYVESHTLTFFNRHLKPLVNK